MTYFIHFNHIHATVTEKNTKTCAYAAKSCYKLYVTTTKTSGRHFLSSSPDTRGDRIIIILSEVQLRVLTKACELPFFFLCLRLFPWLRMKDPLQTCFNKSSIK